jgi:hypothetical protein
MASLPGRARRRRRPLQRSDRVPMMPGSGPPAARPLPRFILIVLAWLVVTFALWWIASPILMWPAKLLVQLIARFGFPDLVQAIEQSGIPPVITFATTLRPGQAQVASAQITVDVNTLLYSFGIPLYAALVVAAREPHWPRKLAIGYAVLLPFVAWGVLADFLRNIAITSGPLVASQTGFSAVQREMIAFAFQFGSLILPTVVPAATWVLTHRAFLERLRGQ